MPNRPTFPSRPLRVRVVVPGLAALLAAASALGGGIGSASAVAPPSLARPDAATAQARSGAPAAPVAGASVAAAPVAAAPVPAQNPARAAGLGRRLEPLPRSAVRALAASQQVTVKVPAAAPTGRRMTVSGTVSPARSGLLVRVQRRYSGSWHTVASTRLTSKGTWSVGVRTPSARGWLRYRAAVSRNGTLPARAVEARRVDNYSRHTYVVAKRGKITVSMETFTAQAAQTYGDTRGWRAGHHRFVRVTKGGDFTLVMAEAKYLPSYSSVCSVKYSCRVGRYVIINQNRWRSGSKPFTGTLRNYRHMVVNHETGHWLGRHHASCPAKGKLAPVMQQQSKSLQTCKPNAWPLPAEIRAVS
jgi:hypothetical protein